MNLPGSMEMFVILGVMLLLFGPSKLPALGSSLGSFIKNFKSGLKEGEDSLKMTDTSAKKSPPASKA